MFNHRRGGLSGLLLSTDSFNRTDNATTLGSTDGSGVLDPLSWTNVGVDNFGITSNAAVAQTTSSRAMTVIDLGRTDFDASVTTPSVGGGFPGFVFRYSSFTGPAQYWFFGLSSGVYVLAKVNVTVTNVVVTSTVPANGDEMRVICRGDNIIALVNGANIASTTDSYLDTKTKIGFTSFQTTAETFDNLFVRAA